jgi:hypothetical protein
MASSKSHHSAEPALIFAWGARDHSTWHLFVALALLMAAMSGFFFIFRIVHPITQRRPVTPQHVISLDPNMPAQLALIHRAQDRSFALLSDADSEVQVKNPLLAFHPSYEGHEIALRVLDPASTPIREPRLFTATSGVLSPVQRRAVEPVASVPVVKLHAILSAALAKRGPASVELGEIKLTQPTRVQFRVAVGSAGQIITALPLSSVEDAEIMRQLQAAITALRFSASEVKRVEWGEISFRWEVAATP